MKPIWMTSESTERCAECRRRLNRVTARTDRQGKYVCFMSTHCDKRREKLLKDEPGTVPAGGER